MNYLRWDVIYRGAGRRLGRAGRGSAARADRRHAPVQRAEGVVILGELLNEDVVPAYVSVKATLLRRTRAPIASEGSFDKISHLLLPKQVTPFLINFPDGFALGVGSVRMDPLSTLISASADPVIEIQNRADCIRRRTPP